MPGRSKVEGREEEEEEEGRQEENEVMNTILAEGWVTRKAASVEQSTEARRVPFSKSELGVGQKDWPEETASGLKQKRGSQVEDDVEEGDVMDWLGDDQMMSKWEDVSNMVV